MSTLKVEDLVRIITQPKNVDFLVVGERGYVSQIDNGYALFEGLKVGNDDCTGTGWVPLDCLCVDEGEDLAYAYQMHKKRIQKLTAECEAFGKKVNKKYSELASRYGITADACRDIYHTICAVYTEREGR